MVVVRAHLVGCLLATPLLASPSTFGQWLDKQLFKRIDITGRRTIGYHMQQVTGDTQAFRSLTYFGQGSRRITDTGQVNIGGRNVLGVLNFQMSLADNRYSDPQAQKISIDYQKKGMQANLGDIRGSLLNSNQFATFSRSLKGVQMGYSTGRLAFKALASQARNSPQTVSIQGNGTTGPYYLKTSQIVDGSIQVKVDGQDVRLGEDYQVNYELGAITFNTRVVPQTSTIVASYEALGYNGNRGNIQGGSALYDLGKGGHLGLTAIRQTSGGSKGLNVRTEFSDGLGPPSVPYTLQFPPIFQNVPPGVHNPRLRPVIKVDGLIQTETIDYNFDRNSHNIFYFSRFMPPQANVEIDYTPVPNTFDGDRSVTGLDYTLPIGPKGKNGGITVSEAFGRLTNTSTPMSGTARGVVGNYKFGNFELRGSIRNIPATYVSVQSLNFNRNERATDLSLDYSKGAFHYGLSHNNSAISTLNSNSNNQVSFGAARSTTDRAYVNLSRDDNTGWNLSHTRTNSFQSGIDTRIDTTGLSTTRQLHGLRATFGLTHLTGFGPIVTPLSQKMGSVALDTLSLQSDYGLGKQREWVLGGKASVSSTRTDGKSGKGNDVALTSTYRPPKGRFSLETNYSLSQSGELAALSQFQNGQGLGYGGNGFSGGPNGGGLSAGAGNYRLFQMLANYHPSERMAFDVRYYNTRSQGDLSSNSHTTDIGLGFNWDMGKSHAFNLSLDRTVTSFINGTDGSSGFGSVRSNALSLTASLGGAPSKGLWIYHFDVQRLLSGGSTFGQNSLQYQALLKRKLNRVSNLGFEFQSGSITGYLPQGSSYMGFLYEHQLYRNVSLVSAYRLRNVRNLDPTQTSGAYRARGLDFELSFNFAP